MGFRFNLPKATEVACEFLERSGGTINIMKLVKLVYLTDRLSLERRGIPVVGGTYFSMKNGPVPSEVLDLINAGRLDQNPDTRWQEAISDRANNEASLINKPERAFLSQSEVELIDEIWSAHGAKDQWALVDWCHEHCTEWTPLNGGRAPITVQSIAKAQGADPARIEAVERAARQVATLDEIFAGA